VIAILLLVCVAVFGAVAYQTAHQVAVSSRADHLSFVAENVASMVGSNLTQRHARLQRAADDAVLRRFVLRPDSAGREGVIASIRARYPRTASSRFEMRSPSGSVLVSFHLNASEVGPTDTLPRLSYDSVSTGRIFLQEGRLFMETGAPILSEGRKIGILTERRELAFGDSVSNALENLVGREAGIMLGNVDGTLWIDLSGHVRSVPVTLDGTPYVRDSVLRIGGLAVIPHTALAAAVDLPAELVLAPVRAIASPLIAMAMVVIAGGALIGWAYSSRITLPLAHLTAASKAILRDADNAAHTFVANLPKDRNDEIGELAFAFSVMSTRIRNSQEHLEGQVAARTVELRAALEQLQAAQEELMLKERLATLGQLSGSVGHELRNPLSVMSNALYLLENSVASTPQRTQEYLSMIRTQIGLSEKIISDLLSFGRIRSPERTAVRLGELIEEQLARLRPDYVDAVEKDLPEDIPPLNIDPFQIGQVLFNIMTNAFQAMEGRNGDRSLRIRSRCVGEQVCIELIDRGPGIRPEDLPRIFEPLFTTKPRGIGLGLSVSRSLVEVNGGSLVATSVYGEGSTFTLTLPATTG
jgi:signal transduction histidine kinase